MEKKKKLVYVEMRYDDGSIHYIDGKKANKWLESVNGCCVMASIHGHGMESYEWKKKKEQKKKN